MALISYRSFRSRDTVTCDRCGQAWSCRFQRTSSSCNAVRRIAARLAAPIGNGEVRKLLDLPIPSPQIKG